MFFPLKPSYFVEFPACHVEKMSGGPNPKHLRSTLLMVGVREKPTALLVLVCANFTGWWCNNRLEKYEFVSWEGRHPIYYEKNLFQTTNQISGL